MFKHKSFFELRSLTICILTVLSINLGCKKNNDSVTNVNVYISGTVIFEGKLRAVYWKNNKQILLPITNDVDYSIANAIFVSENDVYLAGTVRIANKEKAVYWKNNEMFILGNGEALDIVAKGNNIHVVGYFADKPKIYNPYRPYDDKGAAYWKNGVLIELENPLRQMLYAYRSYATCITISGDDIYIGGFGTPYTPINDDSTAILWKNNIANYIDDCNPPDGYFCNNYSSKIKDIVVQENDIYMIGEIVTKNGNPNERTDEAVYWKNNISFPILNSSNSSYSNAIGVKDSTIYAVGPFGVRVFNNNGNNYLLGLELYGQYMNITGIAFNKNDEYVCGYSTNNFNAGKVYSWKNNIHTELAPYGTATDIVVVKP